MIKVRVKDKPALRRSFLVWSTQKIDASLQVSAGETFQLGRVRGHCYIGKIVFSFDKEAVSLVEVIQLHSTHWC